MGPGDLLHPTLSLAKKSSVQFCLVIPTQLLSNIMESHQVDLAYLHYLPFCSVFTFARFPNNLDKKNPYIRITHLIVCLSMRTENLNERTSP